eukprot:365572-Chlamydomonas_euryale.AAC.3
MVPYWEHLPRGVACFRPCNPDCVAGISPWASPDFHETHLGTPRNVNEKCMRSAWTVYRKCIRCASTHPHGLCTYPHGMCRGHA